MVGSFESARLDLGCLPYAHSPHLVALSSDFWRARPTKLFRVDPRVIPTLQNTKSSKSLRLSVESEDGPSGAAQFRVGTREVTPLPQLYSISLSVRLAGLRSIRPVHAAFSRWGTTRSNKKEPRSSVSTHRRVNSYLLSPCKLDTPDLNSDHNNSVHNDRGGEKTCR
uniref:Uncharacterized protein n=1 Tax=Oryza punctata TaxID=4537 RepID=A0A0E0KB06_ORYPU